MEVSKTISLKPGTILDLEIEKFADRGKSMARVGGYVVFVDGAVPGDRVRVEIGKKRKKYAEARVMELLEPGSLRVQPRCIHAGVCGGCRWQHVRYEAQLEAKRQSVQDAFVHLGGFRDVNVRPAIGMDDPYYYRNKMEYSFSSQRWLTREEIASGQEFDTSFGLGLHVPENFAKVLDISECHLQSELSANLVNSFRTLARTHGWEPWDTRNHTGFLRHLVVRHGARTGEVMVNLVTCGFDADRMERAADFLKAEYPQITTFVNTINTSHAQTAFGEEIRTIFGPGIIHDEIGSYRFEIAPNAFFQTNTVQAEKLYEVARSFAELRPDDLVYDLYCGAGTISIFVAGDVRHVVGVELVEEAVVNARANARYNGVQNCTFISGDMLHLFTPDFVATYGRPDVMIVDPPRSGMHPKVVERIADLRPSRLVYVSCNPQTQARDLATLKDLYQLNEVQPVDLFPHTYHIESVAGLRLK